MTLEWVDAGQRVPEPRAGLVPRSRLVSTLTEDQTTPVVLLIAGAGYGKTTVLAEWARTDVRRFAWVSLSERHDDAPALLDSVLDALAAVEPIDPETRAKLAGSAADYTSVRLPRLARAVAGCSTPFVLVLDDVHLLTTTAALATLQVLCESVPPGSQIALATREAPKILLGTRRARRDLLTLDTERLAMDTDEGMALLEGAGLHLDRAHAELVVERTEGWPAALYLAALAIREQPSPKEAATRFAGDDRLVADYLRDELFDLISEDVEVFLTRTSILDHLSGPLCDATLGVSGSAEILRELEGSNLLVIPLDRSREWFRYHLLLRDELLSRLRQREPDYEATLHDRASEWYEKQGDMHRAIVHAAAAGDDRRFDELVWQAAPSALGSGHPSVVRSWLDLRTQEQIATRPALAVAAAWCAIASADIAGLEYWTSILLHVTPQVELPDGAPISAATSLLVATLGQGGLVRLRDDAARAYELQVHGSPYRVVACMLEGAALRLLGDTEGARGRLDEGAAVGRLLLPAVQTQCLSQRAALDIDQGEWETARLRIDEAMELIARFGFDERPAQVHVYSVAALVAAHEGATDEARRNVKHALWLLSMIASLGPWMASESHLLLARASLLLGDLATARVLCREAKAMIDQMPDSGDLLERHERVAKLTDAESIPLGVSAAPMTPAEMRVLRYLPTHLTFAAIADELFVSRNTVKTQAISIYRKLGVSSRTPAVTAARDLGLLEE